MESQAPHDVNSSQMRAVYGNRLRLDDPLLGDNPKVIALRQEQADTSIKTLIDEAIKKFFFPEPEPTETDESDLEPETKPEIVPPVKKPETNSSTDVLVSIFKMLIETLSRKSKG
jgi:hypothetical protein